LTSSGLDVSMNSAEFPVDDRPFCAGLIFH
jgi:hypothetical protein